MTVRQLSALLDEHAEMDEAFLRHQDALLMRNAAGAAAHLERFSNLLVPHLLIEEELLMPIYTARGKAIVGAAPVVFHAEHKKIRNDLQELKERTLALQTCDAGSCKATLRQYLALIDREYLFKDYLKHHDLRERNALYPELDRITPPDEKQALWDAIARRQPT